MNPLETPQKKYRGQYNSFGVIIPSPMVAEVLENKHGVDNPVIDLNIGRSIDATIVTSSLSVILLEVTSGVANGSNTVFGFAQEPAVIVVNGDGYQQDHGWTWGGTSATLSSPPAAGADVYGIQNLTGIQLGTLQGTVDNANVDFTASTVATATGTIDNSNTAFTFVEKPQVIVVNGRGYRENHGWTWSSPTATLSAPVGVNGDIYGLLLDPGKPKIVVVNGKMYREDHGWSYVAPTVTLDNPVGTGGDIYAIV